MTDKTFRFPHKCLKCNMHFNVYSSNPDWADRFAYCPECGKRACFPLGVEESDRPIYEMVGAVVPGITKVVSIKQGEPEQLEFDLGGEG